MKTRLSRAELFSTVCESLSPLYWNDKPAIRQAMNDTADSYRKDGYNVPDYAQDKFVRDVSAELQRREP